MFPEGKPSFSKGKQSVSKGELYKRFIGKNKFAKPQTTLRIVSPVPPTPKENQGFTRKPAAFLSNIKVSLNENQAFEGKPRVS